MLLAYKPKQTQKILEETLNKSIKSKSFRKPCTIRPLESQSSNFCFRWRHQRDHFLQPTGNTELEAIFSEKDRTESGLVLNCCLPVFYASCLLSLTLSGLIARVKSSNRFVFKTSNVFLLSFTFSNTAWNAKIVTLSAFPIGKRGGAMRSKFHVGQRLNILNGRQHVG